MDMPVTTVLSDHPVPTALAVLAVSLAGALYLYQGHLIYPSNVPSGSRAIVATPDMYDMPHFEDLTLETSDGVKIRAYLIKRPTEEETKKAVTVLFLHANAGNMGHRLPLAREFYRQKGANVFMLSYRGYGLSEGVAEEKGMNIDAQRALDYIRDHKLVGKTKIVLYSQSIGGAVAINLLSKNEDKITAAILENTFLSIRKLIPHIIPIARWFTFLCHQRWESHEVIRLIQKTPMLFLAGEMDNIVPPTHMKELFKLCPTQCKKVWKSFPRGEHNDTCMQPGYFEGETGEPAANNRRREKEVTTRLGQTS